MWSVIISRLLKMQFFWRKKVISFLRKKNCQRQFALLFSHNSTRNLAIKCFCLWCCNVQMSHCLSPGSHFFLSLHSINEYSLRGGHHVKYISALKAIRKRKACRVSGKNPIKRCNLWPKSDHSSTGSSGFWVFNNI